MLGLPLTLARRTAGLLLGLLLVCLVGLAATVQVAACRGYSSYAVHGGSMEPAIPLGALVFVTRVDPAIVERGDVITVRTVEGPDYTHRVVAIDDSGSERYFQTRGDANATPEPTMIPARAIVGRVAFWIPVAGFVIAMLALPSGIVCIVSLLGALHLLFWLLEDLEPRPAGAVPTGSLPEPNAATAYGQ